MDFIVHFIMGTGGHYITMLPADWSISTSHDPLPSSCCSEKMALESVYSNVHSGFTSGSDWYYWRN